MRQNGYIKSQTYMAYKPSSGHGQHHDDGMVGVHAMPKFDAVCGDCAREAKKTIPIDETSK